MEVAARRSQAIEAVTVRCPDADHLWVVARTYYVAYDVVWTAVNRYLKGENVSLDRNRGIVSSRNHHRSFEAEVCF